MDRTYRARYNHLTGVPQLEKPTLTIDGAKFSTLEEFAHHFNGVVLNNEWQWHGNYDAFNDILRGGFGSPLEGFVLRWKDSALSRERLGYPETIKWLEETIQRCCQSNVPIFQERLAEARAGRGQTVFDTLIEIIQKHGPGGIEEEDGIDLLLL